MYKGYNQDLMKFKSVFKSLVADINRSNDKNKYAAFRAFKTDMMQLFASNFLDDKYDKKRQQAAYDMYEYIEKFELD